MSMLLTLILNNIFVIVFIFLLYFFHCLPCSSGVHSLDISALNIGNTEAENIPTTTSIRFVVLQTREQYSVLDRIKYKQLKQ
jgi:hypothetical protein